MTAIRDDESDLGCSYQYHIDTLPLPSKAQLDELIQKAHSAFGEQRHTTFPERRRFLRTFKRWMMANLRDIVR